MDIYEGDTIKYLGIYYTIEKIRKNQGREQALLEDTDTWIDTKNLEIA